MKTSNKFLAVASLLLITAVVVNALTLKSRFNRMVADTPAALHTFPAEQFNAMEVLGTAPNAMVLFVRMVRSDRFNVTYTDMDFIHISQDGMTLKVVVDHPKGYTTDIRRQPEITIECPDLIALKAVGTSLDSLELPADSNEFLQQAYRRSMVYVRGFQTDRLHITAENGMEITIDDSAIASLTALANRAGKLTVRRNKLTHATLNVGNEGTITLDQTQIGTLSTDVAEKGQLIVKGAQLITAHGNGEHRNP